MTQQKEEYLFQLDMAEKFLNGIKQGENPFSDDPKHEEYPHYVQYRNYELALQNSQETYEYDVQTTAAKVAATQEQIAELQSQIDGLNAYKTSVEQEDNLVSDYPEYEQMYLLYCTAIQTLETDYQAQREKIESDETDYNNQYYLEQYQEQLNEYELLIESIQADTSCFDTDDTSTCKLLYDEYVYTMEGYERVYESAKDTYEYYLYISSQQSEETLPDTSVESPELLAARQQMESAEAAIDTYKTKMLAQYTQAKAELEAKITELEMSASSSTDKETLLRELRQSYQNSVEQQYHQTLTQIDTAIQEARAELSAAQANLKLYQTTQSLYGSNVDADGIPITLSLESVGQISSLLDRKDTLKREIAELTAQIKQTNEQLQQGTIKAEQDGVVNAINPLTVGDMLSSGTVFATIIPLKQTQYKVQLYVNNSDIATIKTGDLVKYNIAALPSNQYGMVDGYVTSISQDTMIQNGEYSGYYLVEASIDNVALSDKDGNTGHIGVGMLVEAKIVTQQKTIIRYLLEKINLF